MAVAVDLAGGGSRKAGVSIGATVWLATTVEAAHGVDGSLVDQGDDGGLAVGRR